MESDKPTNGARQELHYPNEINESLKTVNAKSLVHA